MDKNSLNTTLLFIIIFIVLGGLSINSFFDKSYENCSQGQLIVGCSPLSIFNVYNFFINIFYVFLLSLAIVLLFLYRMKWMFRLPALYIILLIFLFTSGKYWNDMGILWIILSPGAWIPSLGKMHYILNFSIRIVISIVSYSLIGLSIS